ncbi:hypothetical protein ACUY2U_02105, partial [Corynebacterium phoceense]
SKKNKPTPQPHRQTTNKAMTWHIQKLHKINNTDPHTRRGKRGASKPSQTNATTVHICTDKQT